MFITCILKTRFWKSFERCGECKENWSKGKTGGKKDVCCRWSRQAQIVSKRGCGKTCCYAKYFMAKWSNSLDEHTNASKEEYCQFSNLVFGWNGARMTPNSKFCDLQPPTGEQHFKIQPLPNTLSLHLQMQGTVLATEIYYAASTSRHKIEFCGPQDHSRYPDLKRKSVLWTECTFKTDQGKLWESGAPGLKRGSQEITQPASGVKMCGGTGLRSYAFPACLKLKSVSNFKCAKLKTR